MTSYSAKLATHQPDQVWSSLSSGAETLLLANADIANTVYISDSRSIQPGGSDVTTIPPLGTVTVSARRDLFIMTDAGKTASLLIYPDGDNWSPSPVQIAQQNALAGIGVSTPQIVVAQQQFVTNAAWGPINASFPFGGSYELVFSTPGTSSQISDVLVQHVDNAGNVLYAENFTVATGAIGNFNPVIIRGNLQGPKLIISGTTCSTAYITALGLINGPFNAGPLNMTVYGSSLPVSETRPKMVPSNVQGGIIQEIEGVSLAAGASQGPVPMPSYAGRAICDVFSPGTLGRMTIQGFRVSGGSTPQFTMRLNQIGTGSTAVNEIIIPQFFCTFLILNGDSVARTINAHAMAADYV